MIASRIKPHFCAREIELGDEQQDCRQSERQGSQDNEHQGEDGNLPTVADRLSIIRDLQGHSDFGDDIEGEAEIQNFRLLIRPLISYNHPKKWISGLYIEIAGYSS